MAGTTKNTNIITINGKRYNSLTGELLGMPPRTPDTPAPGRVIDGVVRRPASSLHPKATLAQRPLAPVKPATIKVPKKMPRPSAMDIARAPGQHAKAHHPQRSETLMRRAVAKPKPGLKRYVKAHTRTDVLVKQPSLTVVPKISYGNTNPRRLEHAKRIAKSELIRKFAPADSTPVAVSPRPLSPAPKSAQATISLNSMYATPSRPQLDIRRIASAPASQHVATSKPAASAKMDIFEQALAVATSHEQPKAKLKKTKSRKARSMQLGRLTSIGAATLAVVLLCGFFVYQNKANLLAQVASTKTGFHVAVPGYRPSGFSFASIHYNPGVASISFHSNSDDRSFTLTQKSSNWNSQALLENFVATNDQSYQAYEAGGRTVYVYGGNATWVNGGVWYQLTTNNSLTTEQLVRMAASI